MMNLVGAILAAILMAALSSGPSAAQSKPKKSIDQIRTECRQENPSGGSRDQSTVVSRCIQRKKEEQGEK